MGWKKYIRNNVVYYETPNYLLQDLSIYENIQYFSRIMGASKKKIKNNIDEFKIKESNNKIVALLSDGSKQKLALSIILSSNKKIFLFDEPENNLDIDGIEVLYSLLNKKNENIIIFSSHIEIRKLNLFKIYEIIRDKEGAVSKNV